MSSQFPAFPDEPVTHFAVPGPPDAPVQPARGGGARAVAVAAGAALAVVVGTALLGVAAGYVWAALAPRAGMVMEGHASAVLANAESTENFTADAVFCLVC